MTEPFRRMGARHQIAAIMLALLLSTTPALAAVTWYTVIEKQWNESKAGYDFYNVRIKGSEIPLKADARRHFISENQAFYPEPESACGPIALLNLYIWYSKFGLLRETVHHSDIERYKKLKFQEIDRKLLEIQRATRSETGGSNALATVVAMDELLQEHSKNGARLHCEIIKPPLSPRHFIELSRNYRTGILSTQPKDQSNQQLLGSHAVLCIRGDREGVITIANWGEFYHGRLVQRSDGQWFVPRDPEQNELKINHLVRLVPFQPVRRGGY